MNDRIKCIGNTTVRLGRCTARFRSGQCRLRVVRHGCRLGTAGKVATPRSHFPVAWQRRSPRLARCAHTNQGGRGRPSRACSCARRYRPVVSGSEKYTLTYVLAGGSIHESHHRYHQALQARGGPRCPQYRQGWTVNYRIYPIKNQASRSSTGSLAMSGCDAPGLVAGEPSPPHAIVATNASSVARHPRRRDGGTMLGDKMSDGYIHCAGLSARQLAAKFTIPTAVAHTLLA
jgi:hypothetical protein